MKNGKFISGVIAGLGAGTVFGILFAPAKGSVTRKNIMKLTCSTDTENRVNIHDVMRKNKEQLQQREEVL